LRGKKKKRERNFINVAVITARQWPAAGKRKRPRMFREKKKEERFNPRVKEPEVSADKGGKSAIHSVQGKEREK